MSGKAQQQSRIKELITLGREQGYLTYAEVNDHLPEDISDPEQVEDIIRMINDMGINVFETAPDKDSLMLADADTDEAAAAAIAAALACTPGERTLKNPGGRFSFLGVDIFDGGSLIARARNSVAALRAVAALNYMGGAHG